MADVLPGFVFANGRYRNQDTGRFVSRADILALLESQLQSGEDRLVALAIAFYEGRISYAVWIEQTYIEERRLGLQHSALAKGGFDRFGLDDAAAIAAVLALLLLRNRNTARDVQAGEVTLPQLLNRVNGYIGSIRRLYFATRRRVRRLTDADTTIIERRILSVDAQHCRDCPIHYQRGWQVLGTLPSPGEQCQCGDHCRCGIIEREVPTADLPNWIGTRR